MKIRLVLIIGIILLGVSGGWLDETRADFASPIFIPQPPQSTLLQRQSFQSAANNQDVETEISHYLSVQPIKEISEFYQRNLTEMGWQKIAEYTKKDLALLTLTKDHQFTVNITAYQKGEESEIYVSLARVLKGLSSAEGQTNPLLQFDPTSDTAGRDPHWAPRYPGSIRRMYNEDKQSGQVMVAYAAEGPVEKVIKFYTDLMPNQGWWLKDKVQLEEIPGFGRGDYQNLVFENSLGSCVVSVNKPFQMSKFGPANENLTAILLTYVPKK